MNVNFLDLKKQYLSIKSEIDSAIQSVLDSCAFAGGPFVTKFEQAFAAAHEARFCAGMNNGTSALHAALSVLGIGPGHEVIVPANTFFATPEAVSLTGAVPVFADCEKDFFNIDPGQIERLITKKTRAIIPVHLYGQPARMDEITEIARRHGLELIEDCAQAHLARYKGKPVGTFGRMGCFSFYPGKNLGAYGEGGAVLTNEPELYEKLSAFKDHGSPKKYFHDFIGHNYRMTGFQGAILSVKLKYLEAWTKARQEKAAQYRRLLGEIENITLPAEMPEARHVYHIFAVRSSQRDKLVDTLSKKGVHTGIHYPLPCHLQKAYASLGYREGDLPVSESCSREVFSLPMSAELTKEEIIYVSEIIKEFSA